MRKLDIKITFKCNNHCKFCVKGDRRNYCFDKDNEEIKMILTSERENHEIVVFSGGEVTIRPDILELVNFAKRLNYNVNIQTNGRMFAYKEFCIKMIEAGVSVFAISIHGHKSKSHDYLTQAKGSFEQSSLAIKNLISLKQVVVTNTVINEFNYRFLSHIANFLIDLGIEQYQFAFPHIMGNAFVNRSWLIPRKKEIAPYVRQGLELGIRRKLTPRTEAIPYCFLIGYENCVAEEYMPDTKVFDVHLTENFSLWRKNEGKKKGPKCRECKYFQRCEGPWREYPEIFGWDEFKPVK